MPSVAANASGARASKGTPPNSAMSCSAVGRAARRGYGRMEQERTLVAALADLQRNDLARHAACSPLAQWGRAAGKPKKNLLRLKKTCQRLP